MSSADELDARGVAELEQAFKAPKAARKRPAKPRARALAQAQQARPTHVKGQLKARARAVRLAELAREREREREREGASPHAMPPFSLAEDAGERERRPSGGMLSVFELCNNSADESLDTGSERADTPLHSAEEDEDEDEERAAVREGWSDHNRWYCNICKDGGELLCCDRCPRAFHMSCLGMDDDAIPASEWYCRMCAECLDRRRAKKESKEKARVLRETAKLERDAKRLHDRQLKEELLARKSAEAIEHKAKRVLEMQDRILSRRKIKYKDKDEETLGRLAEDLAQTVRTAKEKLEKLEKEDLALRRKEDALNKKRRGLDDIPMDVVDHPLTTEKPSPAECVFGDIPAKLTGQVLAVWDSIHCFHEMLNLSPLTVDQFAAALGHKEHCTITTEVHVSLLQLVLEDREDDDYASDDEGATDEGERYRYEIQHAPLTVGVPTVSMLTALSWPSILHSLIAAVPRYTVYASPVFIRAFKALGSTDYPQLDIAHKLALLRFLVGRFISTERVRSMLGKHLNEALTVTKNYNREMMQDKKLAMEDEKKLREKQRIELAGVINGNKTSVKLWFKNGEEIHGNGGKDDDMKSDGEGGTGSGSETDLDELADNEDALTKNEDELENLQAQELISRHEYLSRKKRLDKQRERIRQKTEEKLRKQKIQEQMERRRSAAKKGITDGLSSKDASLLRLAIEKGKECNLPARIIVSATHVLELLDAETAREEDATVKKDKYHSTLRELLVRTEPLGRDRDHLRYWILQGDQQRLYVEKPAPPDTLKRRYDQMVGSSPKASDNFVHASSWFCYSSQVEINSLMSALDLRISREAQLRVALNENMDTITEDMPVSKPGLLISDMLNEEALHARKKRRTMSMSPPPPADKFLEWKNDRRQPSSTIKMVDSICVDALRKEYLEVEHWLSKRLRAFGSDWIDRNNDGRGNFLKTVEAAASVPEMIAPLLALENEITVLQIAAQEKAALAQPAVMSSTAPAPETGTLKEEISGDHDLERSDDDEEEDDEELDALADDGSILWPTKHCRARWVNEVKKATTIAVLSTAMGSFVHRLELFGISASEDVGAAIARAKSEKEKRTRKERVKKKQKKHDSDDEDEVASTVASTASRDRRGESMDEWEEDCYICGEGGEVLCCDGCAHVFHHACVGLRRIPRGKIFCHECDSSVKPVFPTGRKRRAGGAAQKRTEHVHAAAAHEESVGSTSPSSTTTGDGSIAAANNSTNGAASQPTRNPDDIWDQDCSVCSLGGELLCCDGCPRAFHVDCIGLKEIPETEWFCDECNLQTCGSCKKNKIRLDSHVICGSEDGSRGCERVFHLKCARLSAVPADDWYCKACRTKK